MGIPHDVWMKFWMEPRAPLQEQLGDAGMGHLLWCLLQDDAFVVSDDLLPYVKKDNPWLAEHLSLMGSLMHHRLYMGPSAINDHIEDDALKAEFKTKFPEVIDEEGNFLVAEFTEARGHDREVYEDIEDFEDKVKRLATPDAHQSVMDAMQRAAKDYGFSHMLNTGQDLQSLQNDHQGNPVFNTVLGDKAIDQEVEKFRAEMDDALDGWGRPPKGGE